MSPLPSGYLDPSRLAGCLQIACYRHFISSINQCLAASLPFVFLSFEILVFLCAQLFLISCVI